MKWYNNMKLGTKMISGFIIVALIAGLIGSLGIVNIRTIDKLDTHLYETMTVPLGEIAIMLDAYQRMRSNVKDIILSDNAGDIAEYERLIQVRNQEFAVNLDSFETTLLTDEGSRLVQEVRMLKGDYDRIMTEVIRMARAGQDREAYALMQGTEASAVRDTLERDLYRVMEIKIQAATETAANNNATATAATIQTIIILVIAIFISIGLGIFISNSIKKPINLMVAASEKMADGDLNVNIDINTQDEIGILANAFSRMAKNVNDAMQDINSAADQVSAGSGQVAASSQQLSQGATEQASSVEEITASMEELASQTNQNAANATEASNMASQAQKDAEAGNNRMKEMLVSMDEINESSNKISKIIKVIDEIAFQTNILALNAAVEAARAGQHGKGFAVVAEEVRNLAARSANAAKETTEMIEGSIQKVGTGTSIANETAKALENIVKGVSDATQLVQQIATASNEQASGIEQVNEAIMQVSQVTQTNSATSEEAAAASEELSSQAQLLKDAVSRFKLKHAGHLGNRGGFEEMSPEILRMLESVNKNGLERVAESVERRPAAGKKKVKISLDDQEFGKY
ncbi:methyl-accepting chemotaxis protein [Anoxynatronum buryatiense]|uniref:Methyl-accepting chemotaxis sensory transducer n=1 Tax=Anoxynatronum buryatiense TaxID=489973 RepID=A0AA45WTR7_9CLOT|nr:methyl-accepting chemotaxis protein [Anoxynatronum buryatiense]SMP43421.1 methyl-accepting chemotaxis sensory transducer [Anoxynatronum buryatiense]